MCAVVEPKWLQYECGHFALRDNLPWWMDYCMYARCIYSPLHDTPCQDCAQTCNQELSMSSNTIMSGGINRCGHCERARRIALYKKRRRIRGVSNRPSTLPRIWRSTVVTLVRLYTPRT